MLPETRYARSGDVHIAYQVVGDGPVDLVYVPGWVSHVEYAWESPGVARSLRRLASFSRLILFDKRGTGMSDRVPDIALPTLEERMDDVRAVMDAAGSERAYLFGVSEGGPMALLFAATYPERASGLILYASYARRSWAPDYPIGLPPEVQQVFIDDVVENWGGPTSDIDLRSPSIRDDERMRTWMANYMRLGASPGAALTLLRMNYQIDVRDVLPAIRVPTLILHRVGDGRVGVENSRYLAERMPAAKYVELPGADHTFITGDATNIADEVEEFVTGERHAAEPDRVLATVLFTDIVGSTERAAALGDRRWRALLDDHDAAVRRELARFRGREVKTTGDGFLATFDGPARAVRCALAIGHATGQLGLEIRAGLHTGEVEPMGEDVGGIAVHIGQRISALARPGEVLVSSTVKDLVAGSGLAFDARGEHVLRGLPDAWRLFSVVGA